MSEPWITAKFQARTGRCSFESLKADLDLCFTLADLVEAELTMEDPRDVREAFTKAENGYASIARLLAHVRGLRRIQIIRGLQNLRSRLDSLKSRLPNQ